MFFFISVNNTISVQLNLRLLRSNIKTYRYIIFCIGKLSVEISKIDLDKLLQNRLGTDEHNKHFN